MPYALCFVPDSPARSAHCFSRNFFALTTPPPAPLRFLWLPALYNSAPFAAPFRHPSFPERPLSRPTPAFKVRFLHCAFYTALFLSSVVQRGQNRHSKIVSHDASLEIKREASIIAVLLAHLSTSSQWAISRIPFPLFATFYCPPHTAQTMSPAQNAQLNKPFTPFNLAALDI